MRKPFLLAAAVLVLVFAVSGCASSPGERMERDFRTGERVVVAKPYPRCADVTLTTDPRRTGPTYAPACEVR